MGQAQQKRRGVLIVEDDAEQRRLTAALFEDERLDTIECESAEAALAVMLIGGREVAMISADVRLRGACLFFARRGPAFRGNEVHQVAFPGGAPWAPALPST